MAKEILPNTPGYTSVSIYDQMYHLRARTPTTSANSRNWSTARCEP